MKEVGIWIDKREAKIVSVGSSDSIYTLTSNLEEFNISGGSGTRVKGGPQDVVQDSKYLERESHQLYNFFEEIVEYVKDADSIVILGPAEAGVKLEKELKEKHHELHKKVKSIEKTDQMTDNQLIAWVKKYYLDIG